MIDRKMFALVMGSFADRIGRPLAPVTAKLYYAILNDELRSTEEFLAAARIVFQQHRYNTWPAPQLLVDAVRPPATDATHQLAAGETFETVLSILSNVYVPIGEREQKVKVLGPIAERAYRAAGGRRDFENVLDDDVKWLRMRYIEAYVAAASDHAARTAAELALGDADDVVRELVDRTLGTMGTRLQRRIGPASDGERSA